MQETTTTIQIHQELITAKFEDMAGTPKQHILLIESIKHWYMTSLYLCYLRCCTLPGLAGLCSALGRIRSGLAADPFSLNHRKASNARLGPAKIPQPCVDLVNMTAPAGSLPWTVSTSKLEGLYLSRGVLVRNCWCWVSIKEARKQWHSSEKILNPANIESWDRGRFIQFSYAICLHCARNWQAKILKGTEEHEVQIKFVGILVVAPFRCV